MLLILRHCLMATAVVAPAVGVLNESLGKVADSMEEVTGNTLEAIKVSIDFLEQKLTNEKIAGAAGTESEALEGEQDLFKHLDALEGADLRRLETFLRYKDKDKILGNLYRITTSKGHVKWVCLEHYRASYREVAMKSFLHTINVNHGQYDPHLRRVTVTLASSVVAKDFFRQLGNQAPAVNELHVALDWGVSSSDLSKLVDSLARSNVRIVRVDLKDDKNPTPDFRLLGKGRYYPLLELLANRKIQHFSLKRLDLFASRTSNLSQGLPPSQLRSLHFMNPVRISDQDRLANILYHCPNLVELRLGRNGISRMQPELSLAIASLKRLQVLHLFGFRDETNSVVRDLLPDVQAATEVLRELVLVNCLFDLHELQETVQTFASTLEVLIFDKVYSRFDAHTALDLQPVSTISLDDSFSTKSSLILSSLLRKDDMFSQLTQLDLKVFVSEALLGFLSQILPRLPLTHLGLSTGMHRLFKFVNYETLRSVFVEKMSSMDLKPLWDALPNSQVESLSMEYLDDANKVPSYLEKVSLKRLWVGWTEATARDDSTGIDTNFNALLHLDSDSDTTTVPSLPSINSARRLQLRSRSSRVDSWLTGLFRSLDLTRLETLAVISSGYSPEAEEVLAGWRASFMDQFTVHLGQYYNPRLRSKKVTASRYTDPSDADGDTSSTEALGRVKKYYAYDYLYLRYSLMTKME
ncbi:hypothetical protein BC939DRAFT_453974 [Gamsiella multidivaricata]|uniref:uncharacterized protein n=1 Tax=Gamsiella multidivaricata TaxID=101098 RepID=UPI00221F3C55|nr:uncharacterized protein BC939DRAFT_453974 [Gamsiella multidivaricata]KAI7822383.1 hypothetical protein BC939DRAFT_453974 [Gamsiella multidivaricata]